MLQHIDLSKLSHAAETESERRWALEACRWPNGFVCPCCEHTEGTALKTRPLIQCKKCRYQASATARSQLHNNHTQLEKVFEAVKFCTPKNRVSPSILKKELHVTYKTALRFCRLLLSDFTLSNVAEQESKSYPVAGKWTPQSAGLAQRSDKVTTSSGLVLMPSSSFRLANIADDWREKLILPLSVRIYGLTDLLSNQGETQLDVALPLLTTGERAKLHALRSERIEVILISLPP
jgi:hypothetical protein